MADPAPAPTTDSSPISPSLSAVLNQDIAAQGVKRQEISGLFSDIDKSRAQEKSDLAALPRNFNLTADQYKMLFQSKPPDYPNPNMGTASLASQLAILASAFTRRPFTNMLNTAASAQNALKQGDLEASKRAFDEWKSNRDLALKIMEFQKSEYKQQFDAIKADHKDERDDARAKLALLAAQFNDPIMKDMIQLGHMDMAEQHFNQTYGLMVDKFREQSGKLEDGAADHVYRLQKSQELAAARQRGDQAEVARITQELKDYDFAMNPRGGTGAEFRPSQEIQIQGKDGKVLDTFAARESKDQPGVWERSDTGEKIEVPEGGHIVVGKTAQSGRQAAAQITSMIGSANEILPSLRNLAEMPIGATTGWFMGVQSDRPEDLTDALRRSLSNHLTDDESKRLNTQFAGVTRALAILEGQGRATGLVGLQKLNEGAVIPREGDSGIVILGKYAEIRQIVEQNIQTLEASPDIAPTQKDLLEDVKKKIAETIPWTVHDVNKLSTGDAQTVRQFATEKRLTSGPSGAVPTDLPSPSGYPEGHVATDNATGKVVAKIHNGQWAPP